MSSSREVQPKLMMEGGLSQMFRGKSSIRLAHQGRNFETNLDSEVLSRDHRSVSNIYHHIFIYSH
jgi:hypothetical protein